MSLWGDYKNDYERHQPPTETTCKRCGKTGLNWQHDGEAWVLMQRRYAVHKCVVADDFEVVD